MILVISSALRLEGRYGTEGAVAIRRALQAAAARLERSSTGARVVYPDDPLSMLALGLRPLDLASGPEVRAALASLWSHLPGDQPEPQRAVLIVGGDDVIPFYRVSNPVRDRAVDPDPVVLTDNPYGLRQPDPLRSSIEDLLNPRLPVGRLPDFEPPDLAGFLAQIEHLGVPPEGSRAGIFAVADLAFERSAGAALQDQSATFRVSPGWSAASPDWRSQRARLLYFNLHGFDDLPAWRSHDLRFGRWSDTLLPGEVSPDTAQGTVVFAENCYGASVVGRSPSRSVALAFLAHGARAFVGATGLAFGSFVAPLAPALLGNADGLAREFLAAVRKGLHLGEALVKARSTVRDGLGTTFGKKTLLQFVLFGNPLAIL